MLPIGKIKLEGAMGFCLAYFFFLCYVKCFPQKERLMILINDAQELKEPYACRDGRIFHLSSYPTTALYCVNLA